MSSSPQPRPVVDLEQMAHAKFGPLSQAEIRLLESATRGEIAYCGPSDRDNDPANDPAASLDWDAERSIRAEIVRWLAVDRNLRERIDSRGVRVHAARITGKLELSHIEVPYPISLVLCGLGEEADLQFITIPFLDFTGTHLSWLNLDHATVKGDLTLRGLHSSGLIQLCGARIDGNLECEGGSFQNPAQPDALWTGVAMDATNAKVGGAVLLREGFLAEGAVRLFGASVGESLDCHQGIFHNATQKNVETSGIALEATNANVTGSVFLDRGFSAEGVVRLFGAQIGGSLVCTEGKFKNKADEEIAGSGIALEATDLSVGRVVLLRDGFTADGAVHLYGARIGGNLECQGAQFRNPVQPNVAGSGVALEATSLRVDGIVSLREKFVAEGLVQMYGAVIGGSFDCEGGTFRNPQLPDAAESGVALNLEGARITGTVRLCGEFTAQGQVSLYGAQIGRVLDCEGGKFCNPPTAEIRDGGVALDAESIQVGEGLRLRRSNVQGAVRLFAAEIGGNLECDGARFKNPSIAKIAKSGIALDAESAKITGNAYLRDKFEAEGNVRLYGTQITGDLECEQGAFESLDLTNASVRSILDDEKSWPPGGKLLLDGFKYDSIGYGPNSAKERLGWLARQTAFTRQPYRQLASVLKQAGDDEGWRCVCIEMERKAWSAERPVVDHARRQRWIQDGRRWTQRSLRRTGSWLLRVTIGYGYAPLRVLGWLLALVALGGMFYHWGYMGGNIVPADKDAYDNFRKHKPLPDNYQVFSSFLYSLENSFPLVKFGVQDKWVPQQGNSTAGPQPGGRLTPALSMIASPQFLQTFRWIQICLGWGIATLFAVGVTGVVRSD